MANQYPPSFSLFAREPNFKRLPILDNTHFSRATLTRVRNAEHKVYQPGELSDHHKPKRHHGRQRTCIAAKLAAGIE